MIAPCPSQLVFCSTNIDKAELAVKTSLDKIKSCPTKSYFFFYLIL